VNQTIQQETIEIDGVKQVKTIVTTVVIKHTHNSTETYFTHKELINELCRLKKDKRPSVVKDSFARHLKRRLALIKEQNVPLPAPLYNNDTGLSNFYIVQADKTKAPLLFKRVDYD
jgi:hypothetical protein